MSGIPVYTQSPISAAKAPGPTPQTTAPPTQGIPVAPKTNVATTTSSQSQYPTAEPGASSVPAPTSAAQRYAPVQHFQPTPTTNPGDSGPPPPQPGAFPLPSNTKGSNLPPPPKAGETYHPSPQTTQPQYQPPQMSIPPPTSAYRAQPPSSSTSTTTSSSYAYPVPLPQDAAPRGSLEHPPGYVQNSNASTFTSDQRRAQEASDKTPSGLGMFGSDNKSNTGTFGVDPEGVWNTAKAWATTAGQKLSEAEESVWRKVNGKE